MGLFDKLFGRVHRTGDSDTSVADDQATTDPAGEADDAAPGWDTIDAVFDALYPDQPSPKHFGTLIRWSLGGNDPLDGISAYRALTPRPHWHYVSYGLSDLRGERPGGDESGFGFELTFRLAHPSAADPDAEPPMWPLSLMQNLARYVFETGNVLRVGDHLDANGPIFLDEDTELTALLFVLDPLAGEIRTPSGALRFTQLLGITATDLDDVRDWNAAAFAGLLGERDGGITSLESTSLRDDARFAERIERGKDQDGSSVGYLYVENLGVESVGGQLSVTIDALAAEAIAKAMETRLGHGRDLRLVGGERVVLFAPSTEPAAPSEGDGVVTVPMTVADRDALAAGLLAGDVEVVLADCTVTFRVNG